MLVFIAAALLQVAAPQSPSAAPPAERLVDAEARYRSAIALNPSVAAYHESLALVLERRGALADALAEHEQAVALDSLNPRNRAGLGSLLLRMNRPREAATNLQAATVADRQAIPVWLELSRALAADGRPAEAITALESARAVAPADSSIIAALAELGAATATAAGPHDLSGFADEEQPSRLARVITERVFAVVLGIATIALIGPIVGAVLALVMEVPRQWLARRAA
jgi:tetratricopeptide (TPR) repeat protein